MNVIDNLICFFLIFIICNWIYLGLFKIYFEGKNINNISKLRSVEEKFLQVSTVYQQVIQQYIQSEDEEDEEEEDIVDDIINIVFKLYFFMSGEFVVID